MKIFDRLYNHTDRLQVIPTIRPMHVELSSDATGRMADAVDRSTEWVVRLRIEQNFWANQAQFELARNYAVKTLAHQLYENIHKHIPMLENAIASGDRGGAFRIVSDIRKEMEP